MAKVEVKKDLYWVGAVDWNIRDFHGYSTYKGSSYNSFLLIDDKKILFDTVKHGFKNELLENIREIIEPEKIDYIIVNHAEMDHSGSLPEIIDIVKPEKLFCSVQCKKALIDHFHREDWPFEEVKTGQTINVGKRTITFIETKMLHWPDSMFSYINEDKVLISSDAFGQHWATSERFNDEVDQDELFAHAAKYYGNILLPYSNLIDKLIKDVNGMKLAIDTIATDHGLIWRKNPGDIIEAYYNWCQQNSVNKALIVYDTMWKSTEKMAHSLACGLIEEGIIVKMMNLKENHRSDIVTEMLNAKALIFGSPTLNNGTLPTLQDILSYIKGLKPVDKIGFAFGSYGWSGESVSIIEDAMQKMNIRLIEKGYKVKYVPRPEDLKNLKEMGKRVAAQIKGSVPANR